MLETKNRQEAKQPILLEATKNCKDRKESSYNFKDYPLNYDKVGNICFKCKHFDTSDMPNFFCNKACELELIEGLIDYNFCMPACPLKKWQLYDPKEKKQAIVDFYTNKGPFAIRGNTKQTTLNQIYKEINANCLNKRGKQDEKL